MSILVFAIAFIGVWFVMSKLNANKIDTDALAAETKQQMGVPVKVDQYTTLTDITGEEYAIVYHYTLSSELDRTNLSNAALKESVRKAVCANSETRSILDKNIDLHYLYEDENSLRVAFFPITKSECE